MAYYSGTATSLTALRTALLTHAQADGWVLTGEVLSKAGVYFRIQETATNITCLGCESDAVTNPAPNVVSIGRIFECPGYPTRQISFPCNYEVFGFAQEFYLVVNYDTSFYQFMAFGKSSVPGLPGQGGWCGATIGQYYALGTWAYTYDAITIYLDAGGNQYNTNGALMFRNGGSGGSFAMQKNGWVNSGLDGQGWWWGTTSVDEFAYNERYMKPLLANQPSAWNSEAVLLPLRAYKTRPSAKSSMTLDLANARHMRIDNHNPGDILTLGTDKWKVFPWYSKNTAERNGSSSSINHTGTFGWAIRYEGL